MKKILIGIQARSNSTRFPNKIHKPFGRKTMLQRVIDLCKHAANYINRNPKLGGNVEVAVLSPEKDRLIDIYKHKIPIVEGPEQDVLSRYIKALNLYNSDYIVRITADCPMMPPHIISRCIKSALKLEYDYTTNVVERTHKEGWDVEIISKNLLQWLGVHAEKTEDREHVTSLITKWHKNRDFDFPFSICHVMQDSDESDKHTSIDTEEDYLQALDELRKIEEKKTRANESGVYIL